MPHLPGAQARGLAVTIGGGCATLPLIMSDELWVPMVHVSNLTDDGEQRYWLVMWQPERDEVRLDGPRQ